MVQGISKGQLSGKLTREEIDDQTINGCDDLIKLYMTHCTKLIEKKEDSDRLIQTRLDTE